MTMRYCKMMSFNFLCKNVYNFHDAATGKMMSFS
jgi:hypothetical protein